MMTSARLALGKVAIVGIGGTGSYVLDQVAKTPVAEIHLFDGDQFLQHNAFRSLGAATLAELELTLRGAFLFANAFLKASRSKLNRLFTTMFDELKASQAGVA